MGEIPVGTLRHHDQLRQGLMDAIERDDIQAIGMLVQRGAPLYQHYYHKPIPQLGDMSADPHLRDLGLVNPVDWAVLEFRFRAAMQLLELGDGRKAQTEARPRPEAHNDFSLGGETKVALNLASLHGHLGLMRMLLERGAAVGQRNLESMTALHVAVVADKPEAAALLLQYGAWGAETRRKEVLQLALKRKMTGVFVKAGLSLEDGSVAEADYEMLELSSTWSHPDGLPTTPSSAARRNCWSREGHHNAILQGPTGTASAIPREDGIADWGWAPFQSLPKTPLAAASGGGTSVPRPGSSTAFHELSTEEVRLRGELHRAIRKGDLDRLRGLVARGAPLDAACDLGYGQQGNCIDWACVSSRPESALLLLELGDEQGLGDVLAVEARAALFWSASQGYTEVFQQLLHRGADMSQHSPLQSLKEVRGGTLLSAAVFGVRKAETLLLLQHGAWDLEPESQRPQLLAWAHSRKPVAEAFREAGFCDFDEKLAPPVPPYREQGIWEPDYPAPAAIHWEAEALLPSANPVGKCV